uniref:Protein NEOXANTHIN-DEFICIENT 1 n=1 Tax=Aegilops tauschii subsp. strangulata TaxID=200361 RepID=A0A452YK05_AEGTS
IENPSCFAPLVPSLAQLFFSRLIKRLVSAWLLARPLLHPSMEAEDGKPAAGYRHGPPWVFKGSALYQLHLVKAATARAFVPKELRLVEAFGYTLGGMFLARYHDSPAGQFDELVVIAGIVWNPPTSCAWAARVLVNSAEACRHGRKEVGLPSHVAAFSEVLRAHL